jgi:hypothetical membrane protein
MRRSLGIAILSAGIFVFLAGQRLAAPGLFYDEAHQVPAVFAWQGAAPGHFCQAIIGGVPWLTMTYSGAIKPALFALVLDVTGAPFSVAGWRWFGIALVVAGWLWCVTAVGRRVGPVGEVACAALLLTDVTVLLTTRHDWGPTALALALRCAFLALWLGRQPLSASAAFGLGVVTGLAIFEKLSSVVLLAPLAIVVFGQPRRCLASALCGLCVGSLPLAIVNLATWIRGLGLISLSDLTDARAEPWPAFVRDYLSLGQGEWVRRWVLGLPLPPPWVWGEAVLMAALVALGCAQRASRRFMLAYLAIGGALLLLPRGTRAHHWIAGTPFQYAAIAILVTAAGRTRAPARLLLALLLLLRVPGLGDTVVAIAANRTAPRFDPAPSRVAAFLAAQERALVVAATWGIANQIVASAQGRADAVVEPIYADREVDAFLDTLAHSQHPVLYVAAVPSVANLFAARTARVLAAIDGDARWREAPVEAEVPQTDLVRVRKFVRIATP